ncbi:hypothetical protein [Sphingobacterium sp. 18053]|uniref:hypothetical protein n=1 Tax=Sphingobacterium sp. 18053 TaxID=2681401 RepID=UPI00135807E3|nr:hypothetical protein [Sphingobacterium sp. 18053]
MKRILSAILLLGAARIAYAQTSLDKDVEGVKSRKGSFVTELNFNPFKGNLSLNNALNQIKGRYFVQDDLALRLGIGINVLDSAANYGNPYGTNGYFNSNTKKSTGFDVNFGIEKHFKGSSRLSPYIGFDLSIGSKSSKQELSTSAYTMNLKNAWMEVIYQQTNNGYYSSMQLVPNAYTRFGAYAVAGFDFYVSKGLFVGYEFNLGYLQTKYKKPDITVTGTDPGYGSYISENKTKTFKSSLVNGLRVGYAF